MSRGEAPATPKGTIMEIRNTQGEVWTNVKVRHLRAIRRLIRKHGYSDSQATRAVLGAPTFAPAPRDNWLAEAEVAAGLGHWEW